MKQRIAFLGIAVLLIAAIVLIPESKRIDRTFEATEYSFSDPGYAVTHIIAVRGCDRRNLLGHGSYEGTLSIDGGQLPEENDWTLVVTLPVPGQLWNVFARSPENYHMPTEILSLLPDRSWEHTVALLQVIEPDAATGSFSASFCPQTGHFLVSESLSRQEALAEALRLTAGTALEPVFSSR